MAPAATSEEKEVTMKTTTMYNKLTATTYKYAHGTLSYVVRPIIAGRVIDRIICRGTCDEFEDRKAAEKWLEKTVTEDGVSVRVENLWVATIHRNILLLDIESLRYQFVKRHGYIMAEETCLDSRLSRLVSTRPVPTEETRGL